MALLPFYPGMKEQYSVPIAILPLPTISGSKATILAWYYSLGIPLEAPNPDAGWAFVKFASGPEGALALAKSGFLPVYTDEAMQDAWIQSGALGGDYLVKTRWAGYYGGAWSKTEQDLMNLMDTTINNVLSGTKPLEASLATYNQERVKITGTK